MFKGIIVKIILKINQFYSVFNVFYKNICNFLNKNYPFYKLRICTLKIIIALLLISI